MKKLLLPDLTSSFLRRHNIGEGNLCIAQGLSVARDKFDFDVYLPTKKLNLQRPLVWTLDQKQALIESVIIKRAIPPICVIQTCEDVYQVIDGKQRLSAFIDYIEGGFDFCGYYCNELPEVYLDQIKRHSILAYRLCEYDEQITDADKIEWFKWINFSGTPQDASHISKLLD